MSGSAQRLLPSRTSKEKIPISNEAKIQEILDSLDSDDSEFEDGLEADCNGDDSDDGSDPEYLPGVEESEDNIWTCARDIAQEVAEPEEPPPKLPKRANPGSSKRRSSSKSKEPTPSSSNQSGESVILNVNSTELKAKSGKVWLTKSDAVQGKTPARNVIHIRPGTQPSTGFTSDVLKVFELYFTDDIMQQILVSTNLEISRQRVKYREVSSANLKDTCVDEIRAVLSVLILSGALKDNHLSTEILFNETFSGNRYLAILSKVRFEFLINCLRFDDRETRDPNDAFAPVRTIWEILVENCKTHYKPGSYLTIDEQLIGFRGRCKFKMYIPNKPDKYGLKLVMMCDASCYYMVDAVPYLGKGSVPQGIPAADHFVETLVQSVKGSNRNVTMDNWFTSIPLIEKMKSDYKLTVIGTVKKNKRELPAEFVNLNFEKRKPGSSMFIFDENMTGVSYKPKPNKLVCLLSSMHETASVNEVSRKPEIILNYNQTKGGVDTFDQLCHSTNVIRKTKRWPLCFFFNMVNIAVNNSYVVYVNNFFRNKEVGKPLSRLNFMFRLHERLAYNWLKQRKAISSQTRSTKLRIEKLLKVVEPSVPNLGRRRNAQVDPPPENPGPSQPSSAKRRICGVCNYAKRRMTNKECAHCQKALCGEHQVVLCQDCDDPAD